MKVNLSLGKEEVWVDVFTYSTRFDIEAKRKVKIVDCNTIECISSNIDCNRCIFKGGSEYLLKVLEEVGRVK